MADFLCLSYGLNTRALVSGSSKACVAETCPASCERSSKACRARAYSAPCEREPDHQICEGRCSGSFEGDGLDYIAFFPATCSRTSASSVTKAVLGTPSPGIVDGGIDDGATRASSSSTHKGAAHSWPCAMDVKSSKSRQHALAREADMVCPICEQVLYRPIRTRCGHNFCLSCITIWLRESQFCTCPLCRGSLEQEDAADSYAQSEQRPPFVPDRELEMLAIAQLGIQAYHERELDTIENKLEKKLKAYRERLDRSSKDNGASVVAFMSGMQSASWLGDQGKYCLMRSPYKALNEADETIDTAIWILNLSNTPVTAQIFEAKPKKPKKESTRRCKPRSIADFVLDEPKKKLCLEAGGEPLATRGAKAKSEVRIALPRKATRLPMMILSVCLKGLVVDVELGSCKVQPGQRFILCEFDDSAREVLRDASSTRFVSSCPQSCARDRFNTS